MKLKEATMIFVLALVCLPSFFLTGDACASVPSMAMKDACLKACNTQPLYQLCLTTLRHAPPTGEVTVYALVAAKFVQLSYESTMDAADQLLQNRSLPGNEREAYTACKDKYANARSLMVAVLNQLFACSFTYVRQNYVDAMVAVESCGNGLWAFQSSPLYAMNAADQNKTMLASDLGALIVGK